ncbi:DUF2946 domain-containing protein [Thauera sp. WB-2]|uniref:DUF2946 domain-containing protein n=1 Tax=Thauera sp. WB-2 TaxID=2897772 RepID=UPI0022DE870C|nr:DUF2946 domain-containing protein [Thauera sp. WB-2]WBL63010.1 DUF2946 domain-containing protein [Thauera sp. WB-2]
MGQRLPVYSVPFQSTDRIHRLVMRRLNQPLFAWLAIFAMMMAALAPTISRAMGPDADGRYLIEVCSAEGSGWVAVGADQFGMYSVQGPAGGDDGDPLQAFKQCPYCGAHAGVALLPALAIAKPGPDATGRSHPWLFFHAPRPLFAWSPSRPRAPPLPA